MFLFDRPCVRILLGRRLICSEFHTDIWPRMMPAPMVRLPCFVQNAFFRWSWRPSYLSIWRKRFLRSAFSADLRQAYRLFSNTKSTLSNKKIRMRWNKHERMDPRHPIGAYFLVGGAPYARGVNNIFNIDLLCTYYILIIIGVRLFILTIFLNGVIPIFYIPKRFCIVCKFTLVSIPKRFCIMFKFTLAQQSRQILGNFYFLRISSFWVSATSNSFFSEFSLF